MATCLHFVAGYEFYRTNCLFFFCRWGQNRGGVVGICTILSNELSVQIKNTICLMECPINTAYYQNDDVACVFYTLCSLCLNLYFSFHSDERHMSIDSVATRTYMFIGIHCHLLSCCCIHLLSQTDMVHWRHELCIAVERAERKLQEKKLVWRMVHQIQSVQNDVVQLDVGVYHPLSVIWTSPPPLLWSIYQKSDIFHEKKSLLTKCKGSGIATGD